MVTYGAGWIIKELWFDSLQGLQKFLLFKLQKSTLGPVFKKYLPVLSCGVKRPVREADHSFPSSAEVKSIWIFTELHGVYREHFTL